MNSAEQLTNILMIVLMIMVFILMALAVVLLVVKLKSKQKEENGKITDTNKQISSDAKKIAKEYTKESIFKFMEFDKIEDNMIVQKKGNRYLMVVECQGVNYDLMSEAEKVSVEEGFLQFLNTLRHPIQIYVQTRTVNLNSSLEGYKKRLQEIEINLERKKNEYLKKLQSGGYPQEELEREFYEVTKQTNMYEYGKDIIASTERMSLNKNVLSKKYYIIIPYYPEDLGNSAFDKEEIKNLAFSELYTKAQSIIRTLAGCEVSGKIMSSNELVDLLYVAYNRDEAEVFGIDKAIRSGYEELYTTAPDVLDKKMKVLDQEIEKHALDIINEKVVQVRTRKQQEIERKQARFGELIRERAEAILRQNAAYLGRDTANQAIEMIEEEARQENQEEQEVETETKQNTRRSTTRKTTEKTSTKTKDTKTKAKSEEVRVESEEYKGGDTNVGEEAKPKTRGRKPKATA